MADEFLAVLTTTDSEDRASALAASAVREHLAACAQVDGPIRSVYRWEGGVEEDREWRVLLKTTKERYTALERHLQQEHTYDVPEIIATPVTDGLADYLDWVRTETQGQ